MIKIGEHKVFSELRHDVKVLSNLKRSVGVSVGRAGVEDYKRVKEGFITKLETIEDKLAGELKREVELAKKSAKVTVRGVRGFRPKWNISAERVEFLAAKYLSNLRAVEFETIQEIKKLEHESVEGLARAVGELWKISRNFKNNLSTSSLRKFERRIVHKVVDLEREAVRQEQRLAKFEVKEDLEIESKAEDLVKRTVLGVKAVTTRNYAADLKRIKESLVKDLSNLETKIIDKTKAIEKEAALELRKVEHYGSAKFKEGLKRKAEGVEKKAGDVKKEIFDDLRTIETKFLQEVRGKEHLKELEEKGINLLRNFYENHLEKPVRGAFSSVISLKAAAAEERTNVKSIFAKAAELSKDVVDEEKVKLKEIVSKVSEREKLGIKKIVSRVSHLSRTGFTEAFKLMPRKKPVEGAVKEEKVEHEPIEEKKIDLEKARKWLARELKDLESKAIFEARNIEEKFVDAITNVKEEGVSAVKKGAKQAKSRLKTLEGELIEDLKIIEKKFLREVEGKGHLNEFRKKGLNILKRAYNDYLVLHLNGVHEKINRTIHKEPTQIVLSRERMLSDLDERNIQKPVLGDIVEGELQESEPIVFESSKEDLTEKPEFIESKSARDRMIEAIKFAHYKPKNFGKQIKTVVKEGKHIVEEGEEDVRRIRDYLSGELKKIETKVVVGSKNIENKFFDAVRKIETEDIPVLRDTAEEKLEHAKTKFKALKGEVLDDLRSVEKSFLKEVKDIEHLGELRRKGLRILRTVYHAHFDGHMAEALDRMHVHKDSLLKRVRSLENRGREIEIEGRDRIVGLAKIVSKEVEFGNKEANKIREWLAAELKTIESKAVNGAKEIEERVMTQFKDLESGKLAVVKEDAKVHIESAEHKFKHLEAELLRDIKKVERKFLAKVRGRKHLKELEEKGSALLKNVYIGHFKVHLTETIERLHLHKETLVKGLFKLQLKEKKLEDIGKKIEVKLSKAVKKEIDVGTKDAKRTRAWLAKELKRIEDRALVEAKSIESKVVGKINDLKSNKGEVWKEEAKSYISNAESKFKSLEKELLNDIKEVETEFLSRLRGKEHLVDLKRKGLNLLRNVYHAHFEGHLTDALKSVQLCAGFLLKEDRSLKYEKPSDNVVRPSSRKEILKNLKEVYKIWEK